VASSGYSPGICVEELKEAKKNHPALLCPGWNSTWYLMNTGHIVTYTQHSVFNSVCDSGDTQCFLFNILKNRTRSIVVQRYATIALRWSVIIFVERIQNFYHGIEIKLISGWTVTVLPVYLNILLLYSALFRKLLIPLYN
jgi:hypothetical protein